MRREREKVERKGGPGLFCLEVKYLTGERMQCGGSGEDA